MNFKEYNIKLKELFYLLMVRLPMSIIGKIKGNLVYVHWGRIGKNFGDCLSPLILKHYGFTPVFCSSNDAADVVVAGTLLQWLDDDYEGLIIGAGGDKKKYFFKNAKIVILRGKLTESNFQEQKPEALGDPGLLMPLIYKPNKTKTWKVGIVPHFVDYDHRFIRNLQNQFADQCKIINVRNHPKYVIKDITSCEFIISSSLHGLIIADAYHIPNARIVIRETMPTYFFDYKFDDYYSIYDYNHKPIELSDNTTKEEVLSACKLIDPELIDRKINELDLIFSDLKNKFYKK